MGDALLLGIKGVDGAEPGPSGVIGTFTRLGEGRGAVLISTEPLVIRGGMSVLEPTPPRFMVLGGDGANWAGRLPAG